MSKYKANLNVGQRVKFFRTHDKSTELIGTVTRVHPGDDDLVDVKTEAGKGSVSRTEVAHASDVTVLGDAASGTSQEGTTIRSAPATGTHRIG